MTDEPTQDCASCEATDYAANIRVGIAEAGREMALEETAEVARARRNAQAELLEVEKHEFRLLETLDLILHDEQEGSVIARLILERHPGMKGKHDGD